MNNLKLLQDVLKILNEDFVPNFKPNKISSDSVMPFIEDDIIKDLKKITETIETYVRLANREGE